MAVSEPESKKRKVGGSSEWWWKCPSCLKSSVCLEHAEVLCSAGAPGRAELESRLKRAQAAVKKAEMKQFVLQRALKRMGGAAASPTLVIEHAGWTGGGDSGWAPGRLLVSLALPAASLDATLAGELCGALDGAKLELEGCSSGMFYARGVALPERVVDRIPARPTQEMRPGAVMFDATRQRLAIHIRRIPMIKRKDVSSSKLLGYLLQEGLDSLAYEHVPNGRNYKACVFCSRSDQVSVPFTNVKLQPCTGKDIDGKSSRGCSMARHAKSNKKDDSTE